jgi:hypothetical protein
VAKLGWAGPEYWQSCGQCQHPRARHFYANGLQLCADCACAQSGERPYTDVGKLPTYKPDPAE